MRFQIVLLMASLPRALSWAIQNPLAQDPLIAPVLGVGAKQGAFDVFRGHFDQHRPATDTYLQTRIAALYPNRTLTATQDRRFRLLEYAAASESSEIVVRQLDDIEMLKRTVYIPSLRRRDGSGKIAESVVFAGYEVAWGDEEMVAIVAVWSEGYYVVTQWHLISDNEAAAQKLIHDCAAFASTTSNAVWVFDQSHWEPDYLLYQAIQKASWDDVVLDDRFKHALQHDYRSFFKSEEVYKHLNVPWKRGLILLGPPGNGKTISLKAIMKEVKVPLLYVKSFHTYAGDELGIRMIFSQARSFAPCVLILEDLDSLINNQNRAFFLNEVDGLEDNDGLLMASCFRRSGADTDNQIGSTNHFDRLDPALSNRPSRFDRKYEFPNPSREERAAYARYWQEKLADKTEIEFPDTLVDQFADKTDNFSFAYMKEAFISSLLLIAGREPGDEELDFGKLLLEQVDKLKTELDKGEKLYVQSGPTESGNNQGNDQYAEADGPAGSADTGTETMYEGYRTGLLIAPGQKVFGGV